MLDKACTPREMAKNTGAEKWIQSIGAWH
jgi:hypothetical protein